MTWGITAIAVLFPALATGLGCANTSRIPAMEAIANPQYGDAYHANDELEELALSSDESTRSRGGRAGVISVPSGSFDSTPPPAPEPTMSVRESARSLSRQDSRQEAAAPEGEPAVEGEYAAHSTVEAPIMVAEASPVPTPAQNSGDAPSEAGTPGAQQQVVRDTPAGGPLLIYTADLNLAVHEVRERIDQVIEVADDVGGYVQNQNDMSTVIRVPAARFREALSRIEELGDVLHRRVATQDVSEQVRDVRIRLRNAIQMRDRLAELLERADTVPDSLTIERELERLTEIIELLRGQLQSLTDRIAYSTITVRFEPLHIDQEVPRERFRLPFPWLDELGLVNLLRL